MAHIRRGIDASVLRPNKVKLPSEGTVCCSLVETVPGTPSHFLERRSGEALPGSRRSPAVAELSEGCGHKGGWSYATGRAVIYSEP